MANHFRISLRGTNFITGSEAVREYMDSPIRDGRAEVKPDGSYFVDRNPAIFHHILDYLSGRKLHLPKNLCAIEVREEIEFWMIPLEAVPKCCYEVLYNDNMSSYEAIEEMEKCMINDVCPAEGERKYSSRKLLDVRETINKALVVPSSSLLGKVWLFLVGISTITAVTCYLLHSHREFRVGRENLPTIRDNYTYILIFSNPKRTVLNTKVAPLELVILEIVSNVFLLFDLLLRFIITHQKIAFILNPPNIIELISVVISFLIGYVDSKSEKFVKKIEVDKFIVVFGFMYSLRVLRLLRLAETTAEMKILRLCELKSWKIIALLFMVFAIFSIIFGSGMFWVEFENAETFPNILISIWWAVVTITTVGYGDHYPKTALGYLVASMTALIGLLLIAMPIAALSSNFGIFL
ncbi:potassium voltage-gated channel subfamily C member 3-like [Saccostrea echinata]|uniref:potassium voltage-gated channel subfamily C member 3-like n=1 Tax=Saccostrea echinata TaxID=191078 RepID=UPI002A841A1D|nr:potassium voltage-gated channel subfamily C member 3-like [Saccostrea echinata]